MIITYQHSVEDIRLLQRQLTRYNLRFADKTSFYVYWYLLLPAFIVLFGIVSGSFPLAILAFLSFQGASSLAGRWYRTRWTTNMYSPANLTESLLPCKLELLPDRLVSSNVNFVYDRFWRGHEFLRETPGHFLLFVTPVSLMGIPKSAFASESGVEEFRALIKSYTEQAAARKPAS